MRKKGFRGVRCEKRMLSKCKGVCRTHDALEYAFADMLQADDEVKEFQCGFYLDGFSEGEYCTDFVITLANGDLRVRECVQRKYLAKPMTVRLLDASREYWFRHGVSDWGLVIDAEK